MNSAKKLVGLALFVAILSTLVSSAQSPSPASTNAISVERFLVIVETSAAMQKRAENTQKVLGSVISSGLQGQMSINSTIGMWTFSDKLFTGQLPLQLWTQASRQRVALTMVQFLQQQKNEKTPRLAAAWEAATNIVAQSERITVLLITSGSDPVVGTPFDASITESYIKNSDTQRKANMPFLTILRAVKGKFVAFAVNMPPWPLEVPEYPDGFKPTKPAPPVEPKPAPPAIVVNPFDRAVLSPTNTIRLAEPAPPIVTPSIAPTNPVVAAPAPTPPPTPTPTNIPPSAPVVAKVEPQPTPKVEVPPAKTPEPAAPAAVDQKKFPVATILVAGIALLVGVMVVFIALLRWSRRATGTSLITRSMNKEQ